ncbi:MAG: hypothetical protein ACI39F_01775 [Acutalibacteraceae bacterium]
MKKFITIVLAFVLMLSVMPMALSASAEGNVITVGEGGDYEALAEAVTAATEGDTVQLVSDVIAKNVSLTKSITIDTNGYTWTGGEGNGSGSNKANCGTVASGVTVTIINSQRTEPITSEVTKFDVQANSAVRQGSIVLSNNSNLVLKNVAVQSTNGYTNNQPCAIYFNSAKTATLTLDNCYLTSDNWGAIGANYTNSLMQISAKNSIFNGAKCSVFYAGTPSSTPTDKSEMNFENCTFIKPITAEAANNNEAIDTATSSFETVTYNFKNCTAPALFAPSATAVFGGGCAFETVKSGVVVSADESTILYSDNTYKNPIVAGALIADTPVYTKLTAEVPETDGTTTDAISTKPGASIRLSETISGIRFYTTYDSSKIEGTVVEKGTLIGPANIIGDYLTIDDVTANNAVAVKYGVDTLWNGNEFVGSIVGIQEKNYNREFTARAYVKLSDGSYLYSETTTTKTVAGIADDFIADATKEGADESVSNLYKTYKETVDAWAKANDPVDTTAE